MKNDESRGLTTGDAGREAVTTPVGGGGVFAAGGGPPQNFRGGGVVAAREPETSESVSSCWADYLARHKEEMFDQWLGRVRRDLPKEAQRVLARSDHIPTLLVHLATALVRYPDETCIQEMRRDACSHAAQRLQEGCGMELFMGEIAALRIILIYHLRVFEEARSDFGIAAKLFLSSTVHRLLDVCAIAGAACFNKQPRV